ncbi:MAG: gamma-glutamylcyclotransferase [Proteobacteria bacterium]|nr:gamma-glutamylcyclotransferase [Pseudomonadota bacterium]MCH9712155.1 gamma-glutamylcyclotransferase [Pseudomonadota bacterium]MCH9749527.1 gamma-glutamylcyclotransferase [Pseudomonadota bacterium]
MSDEILLFSYGTLQQASVQIETFGRELRGSSDYLLGYSLAMVAIEDEAVVRLSGKTHHPIAIPSVDKNDQTPGKVFEITAQELAHSDKYEVDAYQRVLGQLKSGKQAWVYVQA